MSKKSASGSGLTDQQELFCNEYVKDLNGKQSAIRANYSPDTAQEQSSRLLSNVKVQAKIQKLMDVRSVRTQITADYVLTTIRNTIDRCLQAEPVMEFDHDSKSMVETGEYKFEHMGVLKGCELLGKHLKLFTDKIEITDKTSRAAKIAKARKRTEK